MAKTARDSFKFMLRLPDELRDKLRSASEASGRSMTAEIIERLERSFESDDQINEMASALLLSNWEKKQAVEGNGPAKDRFVYVGIDQNGHPTSWPEIMKILGEMAEAIGAPPESILARIFDADLKSSSEREDQWLELRDFFRDQRAKAK